MLLATPGGYFYLHLFTYMYVYMYVYMYDLLRMSALFEVWVKE